QPFSYRYPLLQGQGNWGSPDDPKSFAAMRYTESRLSRFADLLLAELGQGTVDWKPNFDGTLQEPQLLPAQVPDVLLNGTTGIAVGMTTNIPPHNLSELTAALILEATNPDCTLDELMEKMPGPDFPTGALICGTEGIRNYFATGRGQLVLRARAEIEEGKKKSKIVITEIP
ncbi:MAG: DNA topoisomerase IV subunit A, partial [Planctomycetaceae bacterium]|nr:DNA topoisomerase IV subunit A [Planctomycetaceae bacterium]